MRLVSVASAGERRPSARARGSAISSAGELLAHELVDEACRRRSGRRAWPSPPSSRGPCPSATRRRFRRWPRRRRARARRDRRRAAGTARGRAISAASLSARSCRPPFVNCSIESRRCLTSELTTCRDSASSSARPFSTSRFISAAFSMRSALRRGASCRRIASAIAVLTSSMSATRIVAAGPGNAGRNLLAAAAPARPCPAPTRQPAAFRPPDGPPNAA